MTLKVYFNLYYKMQISKQLPTYEMQENVQTNVEYHGNAQSKINDLKLGLCNNQKGRNGQEVGGRFERDGTYVHLQLIHSDV